MYSAFRIDDKENGFNIVSPNWTIVETIVITARTPKTLLSKLGLVKAIVS